MFKFAKFNYFSDSVLKDKFCQRNYPQIGLVSKVFTIKKAALVSNFCLIGKIRQNFLLPRVIELGCKTFMPFQTLDLHRVSSMMTF